MPDADETRRFEEIIAPLRDDPQFAIEPDVRPGGGRGLLIAGVACCVGAVALFLLGGLTGAVLAVIPWLAGIIMVVAARGRR
jgi:hypothetical protein